MADEERPSLEPPKLFGRRRRTVTAPAPKPAAPAHAAPAEAVAPVEVDAPTAPTEPVVPVFEDSGTDPVGTRPATVVEIPQTAVDDALLSDDLLEEDHHLDDLDSPGDPGDLDDDEPLGDEPTPWQLEGRLAGGLVGVLVGGVMVVLTWLLGQVCSLAVSGTSSCGPALGMAGIVLVFAVAVVVGAILLRRYRCPDPGATSFLGAGITGVIALLFLVDQLDSWLAVVLVPAITGVGYVLSWWVTTTYTDNDTI